MVVPTYINDPIDILSDSVLEMAEKAAYKAHGGTYVEGLWDASASTLVSKITESVPWQPFELRFHGEDIALSYDPEVSEAPNLCRVSGLNPFFGYMSEPPIAPAFREEKPVGLATTALQALGTMVALLENDEKPQDAEQMVLYFCRMWGLEPKELHSLDFLKPTLANRSDIDLIKSVRGKTHRLYGYTNEQNYVSTFGGGYTHSSLNLRRYVDWHRINIVLRYIGTMLCMSDPLVRDNLGKFNFTLFYGLTGREFPMITNSPHMCSLANLDVEPPSLTLSSALEYALAYYSSERVVKSIAQRNLISQMKINLSEDFQVSEIALASLRKNLQKPRKGIMLDMRKHEPLKYDIMKPILPDAAMSLPSRLNQLDVHHHISMYRAVELFLIAKILRCWNGPERLKMRALKDRTRATSTLPEKTRREITLEIGDFFGKSAGDTIWLILKRFRQDPAPAEQDFLTYCESMLDSGIDVDSVSKATIFTIAIRSHNAHWGLVKVFNSSFTKVVSLMNQPTLPNGLSSIPLTRNDHIADITVHLWRKKQHYWVGHYAQRKDQWTQWLAEHKQASPNLRQRKKGELIRYQWLVKWLPHYTPLVENAFSVWPEIANQIAVELLSSTYMAFVRKRGPADVLPPEGVHYKLLATWLDEVLVPSIPFVKLLKMVHSTAKEMSRDISTVLRKLTEPLDANQADDPLAVILQESLSSIIPGDEQWAIYCERENISENLECLDEENRLVEIVTTKDTHSQWKKKEKELMERLSQTEPIEGVAAPEDLDEFAGETMDFSLVDIDLAPEYEDDSVLRNLSPLAELAETSTKVPNLIEWANRANVSLNDLSSAPREKAKTILEVGKLMVLEMGAAVVEGSDTYDIQ